MGNETQFATYLAYADVTHERLALTYIQALSSPLGGNRNISLTKWNFAMLSFPALTGLALREADMTRLIVVATNGRGGLPEDLNVWIRSWSVCPPTFNGAVVFLLSETPACWTALGPDHCFLQDQARRTGRHLVIYATGRTAENDSSGCLASTTQLLSDGSLAVPDFGEVRQFLHRNAALPCPVAMDIDRYRNEQQTRTQGSQRTGQDGISAIDNTVHALLAGVATTDSPPCEASRSHRRHFQAGVKDGTQLLRLQSQGD